MGAATRLRTFGMPTGTGGETVIAGRSATTNVLVDGIEARKTVGVIATSRLDRRKRWAVCHCCLECSVTVGRIGATAMNMNVANSTGVRSNTGVIATTTGAR